MPPARIPDEAFEPIDLARQTDYRRLLNRCPQPGSEVSFGNLWAWAEAYGLQWAWEAGLVWLRQTRPERRCWAPVGDWEAVDWAAARLPGGDEFVRVPECLADRWQAAWAGRVTVTEARDQWDYLYAAAELRELAGNRYHKKKNLLNQFLKKIPHTYHALGPEHIAGALDMQEAWCTWRECDSSVSLTAENRAVERLLRDWQRIPGLLGGALVVDGRMVAYTVAEPLSSDTLVIHFEKADPAYKGVYQAINQQFLVHADPIFTRVNREQDLGDEGLRKAKRSYHPVDFVRKCTVRLLRW